MCPQLAAKAGAVLVLLPAVLVGQTVPTKVLSKPDAEIQDPFTQLSSVRELGDGRVVVADSRDKTVQLVAFGGAAKKIGREGSGPNEYAMPQRLYAAGGDTTYLWDPLNSRFLLIKPDGAPGGTFSLGNVEAGAATRMILTPQAIDSRGRFYYRGPGITQSPEGPVVSDSLPILRFDRATKKTDTLAYMVNTAKVSSSGGQGNRRVAFTIQNKPFGDEDQWAVTPDGRVAIVRAADYHVDWFGASKAKGPAIQFEKLKVTEDDKKAWREARSRVQGLAMTTQVGRAGGSQTQTQAIRPSDLPEPEWPEYKGAFTSVTSAPDGKLWIQRTSPASQKGTTYDVLDANGRLVSKVMIPERTRLIGFGKGTIYLVRFDEDDLQYLQRYRM